MGRERGGQRGVASPLHGGRTLYEGQSHLRQSHLRQNPSQSHLRQNPCPIRVQLYCSAVLWRCSRLTLLLDQAGATTMLLVIVFQLCALIAPSHSTAKCQRFRRSKLDDAVLEEVIQETDHEAQEVAVQESDNLFSSHVQMASATSFNCRGASSTSSTTGTASSARRLETPHRNKEHISRHKRSK